VERFFLYNNNSRDHHLDVLTPYVDEGIVVLRDWFEPLLPSGQSNAYNHCIENHRDEARWLAIVDAGDNYVFSPTGGSLASVLAEYEQWPAVGVHWLNFGNSGHRTKPPGLVIENYLFRADDPQLRMTKSIVQPGRVERVLDDMHCSYTEGFAVDENKEPLEDGLYAKSRSYSKLRLNHYARKSDAELELALARWESIGVQRRAKSAEARARRAEELNAVPDEAILRYVSPLREALANPARRG
jgi:hypothetical protein